MLCGVRTEIAVLAFLATCVISCIAQEPVVSITGPKLIRPGRPYRFSILANALEKRLTMNITLSGTVTNGDIYEMYLNNITVRSGVIKSLAFNTESLESGTYTLIVKTYDPSMNRWNKKSQSLGYFSKQYSALITTSKPLYKAGDMVNFRIFVIDSETRPVELSGAQITISNPERTIIKVFEDIDFKNGVFQGELKLIDDAALGTWRIRLEALGESYSKVFTVREFVLPTLSLEVKNPEIVGHSESSFPIKITASYTFGGPAAGNAEVKISYSYINAKAYQTSVYVPSNGVTFEVDTKNIPKSIGTTYAKVDVTFTDEVSKKVATSRSEFRFTEFLYKFVFVGDKYFIPNVTSENTIILQKFDGTPAPEGTVIRIDIKKYCRRNSQNKNCIPALISSSRYELNSAGSVSIEYTPKDADDFEIIAVSPLSRDRRRSLRAEAFDPKRELNVEVLTKNPMIGHRVKIKVTTSEDYLKKCFYSMISKNIVLKSSFVKFKKNEAILKFRPSFGYAPYTRIIFYFYKYDGTFETRTVTLNFDNKLPNYLNLKLSSSRVEPGNNVELTIQSGRKSTVSLMAIDQRVLLLNTRHDIQKSNVFNLLDQYNEGIISRGRHAHYSSSWDKKEDKRKFSKLNMFLVRIFLNNPEEETSKVTWSSSEESDESSDQSYDFEAIDSNEDGMDESLAELSSTRVRKNFDEAFLWENVYIKKRQKQGKRNQGEETIQFIPPDTITKWIISGVSMSSKFGMGLPDKKPELLTVLLPFFIQLNLPHHVKRGEILEQNVLIFSYLPNDQNVVVSIDRNDDLFEVEEPSLNGWESTTDKFTQQIVATSGSIQVLQIVIRAKIIGYIDISVTAVGCLAGDSVVKPLKVIPEGIPKSITRSVLIIKEDSETTFSQSLKCDLPPTAVEDTTSAVAKVVSDFFGDELNNLERLIKMPYGSGDQNMRIIVLTISAANYLEATGQLTEELKANAIFYIKNGYQSQLQFRRNDGSFSRNGNKDNAGSTWLTAYVVKSFRKAEPYVTVDSSVMTDAINFILSKQDMDGSFREDGRLYSKSMQGVSRGKLSMTAYISIILSEFIADPEYVSNLNTYTKARDQALDFVIDQINSVGSGIATYSLAICSYTLLLANHPNANAVYQSLMSRKEETAEQIYWTRSYRYRSIDIEIASYGLLAVLQVDDLDTGVKIVDYLVQQREEFRGYGSNQGIAVALGALSAFAKEFAATVGTLNINLNPDIGNAFDAHIDSENLFKIQSFILDPYARMLDVFTGRGSTGTAIVSLTCNFYEVQEEDSARFQISHRFVKPSCKNFLRSYICLKYIPRENDDASNMVFMKMTLPSGYVYDTDTELDKVIRKIEQENGATTLNVYIDSLSEKQTCFNIDAIRTCKVENLKNSSIECMDYYDRAKMAQIFYNVPKDLPNC